MGLTRRTRQVDLGLAVLSMGMAVANEVQIVALQTEISSFASRITNLEAHFTLQAEEVQEMVTEYRFQKQVEYLEKEIARYTRFWSSLSQAFMAAQAGHLLPILRNPFFNLSYAFEYVESQTRVKLCQIKHSEEQLLAAPVTVMRSRDQLVIVVGVPCITYTHQLLAYNKRYRFVHNDKLYKLKVEERFVARTALPGVHENGTQWMYGSLTPADLLACFRDKMTFYCPQQNILHESAQDCLTAILASDREVFERECVFEEDKSKAATVRLVAPNRYQLLGKQAARVYCANGTESKWYNKPNVTVNVPEDCVLTHEGNVIYNLRKELFSVFRNSIGGFGRNPPTLWNDVHQVEGYPLSEYHSHWGVMIIVTGAISMATVLIIVACFVCECRERCRRDARRRERRERRQQLEDEADAGLPSAMRGWGGSVNVNVQPSGHEDPDERRPITTAEVRRFITEMQNLQRQRRESGSQPGLELTTQRRQFAGSQPALELH